MKLYHRIMANRYKRRYGPAAYHRYIYHMRKAGDT